VAIPIYNFKTDPACLLVPAERPYASPYPGTWHRWYCQSPGVLLLRHQVPFKASRGTSNRDVIHHLAENHFSTGEVVIPSNPQKIQLNVTGRQIKTAAQ